LYLTNSTAHNVISPQPLQSHSSFLPTSCSIHYISHERGQVFILLDVVAMVCLEIQGTQYSAYCHKHCFQVSYMLSSYAQSGTCHVIAVCCANCADHTAKVSAAQWLTRPVEIS